MGEIHVLVPDFATLEVGAELVPGRSVVFRGAVYQVAALEEQHCQTAPTLSEPATGRLLCLCHGWLDGVPWSPPTTRPHHNEDSSQ